MLKWFCKRSIPLLTMSHSLLMFIYYIQPSSVLSTSFSYGTLFHVTFAMVLGLIPILLVIKMKLFCILYSDLIYLMIEGLFSLMLGVAFTLNYLKVLEHTYGLIITCLSLAIVVGVLLYNTSKQGVYDTEIKL